MFARTSGQKASAADISTKWGWFVALGIAMIALGIAAWLDVITVTIAGTIFVGASLLIGGVLQIIHAFMTKEWRGFILNLFCGILYIGGGLLIMNEPVQGALFLTLLLMAALMAGGVVPICTRLAESKHQGVGPDIAQRNCQHRGWISALCQPAMVRLVASRYPDRHGASAAGLELALLRNCAALRSECVRAIVTFGSNITSMPRRQPAVRARRSAPDSTA